MIHPYEWPEAKLFLTVRNRHQTYSFLLNQVSQAEFIQHWNQMWEADRDRKIIEWTVMELTNEAFDLLEPQFTGQYLLE